MDLPKRLVRSGELIAGAAFTIGAVLNSGPPGRLPDWLLLLLAAVMFAGVALMVLGTAIRRKRRLTSDGYN
jgi:hypothetical protein